MIKRCVSPAKVFGDVRCINRIVELLSDVRYYSVCIELLFVCSVRCSVRLYWYTFVVRCEHTAISSVAEVRPDVRDTQHRFRERELNRCTSAIVCVCVFLVSSRIAFVVLLCALLSAAASTSVPGLCVSFALALKTSSCAVTCFLYTHTYSLLVHFRTTK